MPGRTRQGGQLSADSQQAKDTDRTPGLDVKTDQISNAFQVEQMGRDDRALEGMECGELVQNGQYFDHPYWPTFRKRVIALLAKLPQNIDRGNIMNEARVAWENLCNATWNSGANMAEAKSQAVGWAVPLDSPNFIAAMDAFNNFVEDLTNYSDSQFSRATSFGFWSKREGKTLAESVCDLTLETSGVGTLLDGIPSIDHQHMDWDVQLWGALSRAYAGAVSQQVAGGGKRIHVCIGAEATADNIWGSIESAAVEAGLQGTGLAMADVATFHAAAAVSHADRSLDESKRGGDFPGTLYSGNDVDAARAAADAHWVELGRAQQEAQAQAMADATNASFEPALGDHPYLAIGRGDA